MDTAPEVTMAHFVAVISGRSLLYSLGWLAIGIAIFWGLWRLIQLIPNPVAKTIAWVVWVILVVVYAVDFLFGVVGIISPPLIRS